MQTIYWPDTPEFPLKPCAATVGVFDGVHAGHRRIMTSVRTAGEAAGLPAVVITFDRHPSAVTDGAPPPALTPLPRKLELIAACGVDAALVIRFTQEVSRMPAEEFAGRILSDYLDARALVVGYNFRFGHGGKGTPELLAGLGHRRGFSVEVCPPLLVDDVIVSSTLIRKRIMEGDITHANHLLGRPYELSGRTVRGSGIGRELGFPTVNIEARGQLVPAEGVYATTANVQGRCLTAVTSIGRRQTFESRPDAPVVIEAHLLDFAGDLYDREIAIAFHARLRPQRRFESREALVGAIRDDVRATRDILGRESGRASGGATP